MSANVVLALERSAAWARLASVNVGRVTATFDALPIVVPVSYVLDGLDSLVFAVESDTALSRAIDGAVFAFVSDGHDARTGRWWGVMVRGRARLSESSRSSANELERLDLSPPVQPLIGAVELLHGGEVASRRDLPSLATYLTLPLPRSPRP